MTRLELHVVPNVVPNAVPNVVPNLVPNATLNIVPAVLRHGGLHAALIALTLTGAATTAAAQTEGTGASGRLRLPDGGSVLLSQSQADDRAGGRHLEGPLSADRVPPQAAQQPASAAAAQPPAPTPPVDSTPRRRGSMVGYIDDPVVSSKLRVRFDVGLHGHTPDRAEFFYAKCGCYRDLPPTNAAYDPGAAGPGPGIATDINFEQLYVQGEYAATERLSLFAELPIRWLQPQAFALNTGSFANQSGLSDLRAGVKLALTDTVGQMLTAQLRTYLPTGDGRKGLGTDHASVEPALLLYQQLGERAAIESQVSVWLPIGGSNGVPTSVDGRFAGNVLSYGIGPSFELYRRRSLRVSPVIELVGWHVLNGYQTGVPADASGTDIVNLKFGARTSWGSRGSIYAGYGRALTDADWYNDIVRLEYRVGF